MLSLWTKNTTLVGGWGGVNEHKASMAKDFWNGQNSFYFVIFMERSNNWGGKKSLRWGVRVYKKARFVDKTWTVWKICKSLKSCIALQNLKRQETTVIFLKRVFIKVIGYSWCGIRREKKLVRKLYWTWHKSEVCNLELNEGRGTCAHGTCGPFSLWRAGGRTRTALGGRKACGQCPGIAANFWNPSWKLQGPLKLIICERDRKHMFLRTFWLKLKMWQRLCQ